MNLTEQFRKRKEELNNFLKTDAPLIVGREAVNHYQESFANEGFTDEKLTKWKDVQRRNPFSKWHGHSGQTGKFSNARTTANILTGETGDLMDAIRFDTTPKGVQVYNNKKYARVHNFGGMAKIYGKKPFMMTPRPFMLPSSVLNHKIREKIIQKMKERLNTI